MRIVHAAETDPELRQARFRALESLAGKAHEKAEAVLDAITPTDLKSERIYRHNDEGEVIGAAEIGPSLRDKAFAFAQISDRVTALQQARLTAAQASSPNQLGADSGLLLPDTIEATRLMLAQKVKRLRLLDVEFADNPRLDKIERSATAEHSGKAEVIVDGEWFDN
jgi:hypothetical protein